jgi:glycine/D-amino acid oxidase-like deaminating enzyme
VLETRATQPTTGGDQGLSGHAPSFWAATLNTNDGAAAPLNATIQTDVVIIGGGFTGLNASAELTRRGIDCVILEAEQVGWGASGRNGGMAVLRYKSSWAELAKQYGTVMARSLYDYIHEAVNDLEQNVQAFDLDCSFKRDGHLTAAFDKRALQRLDADTRWLARYASDTSVRLVGKGESAELIGSQLYVGSYFDPRSAGLHPLNYCRGMKHALVSRGVSVFENSPVQNIVVEADGVTVSTPMGEVRARHALLCTNAYTDTLSGAGNIGSRILPINVAVMATAPLSDEQLAKVLPQKHLVTDTKNLLNYFRLVDGGRLLFGGRGEPAYHDHPRNHERLREDLRMVYPDLADVDIDYRWTGVVALTRDNFPHIGAIGNRLFYAIGYGGRGVALTHLLGKHLARKVSGDGASLGPMSDGPFKPIPFKGLRLPLLLAGTAYYKLKDRLAAL